MMNTTVSLTANEPLLSTSASELRASLAAFARERLPEAMVPSRYIILRQLPKLPNGKVDRSQLPLDAGGEPADTAYVAPATPEEIAIAQIWQEVLGAGRIGREDSFFDLGGDSLAAAQMAARVKDAYGVSLSLRRLFERPTVAALARLVLAKGQHTPAAEADANPRSIGAQALAAEAVLPDDIGPEPGAAPPAATPYRNIFLTGGTGYTGAYLLRELLERSDARVQVLVRAKSVAEAARRVRDNLDGYGLWREAYADRIDSLVGDIGRPYFGLGRAAYEALAGSAEMIVHNGALSSYALPYHRLKATNVLGTLEVLRLAGRRRVKPVHFISSLAVFPGHPGPQQFEEAELVDAEGVVGGYRQTKWVSDKLVTLAHRRGIPASVYRPGLITGAQDSGACATDTFLNAAMKGCIQLGIALEFDVMLEMSPVDFCAAAVAHIALGGQWHGSQFHMPGAATVRWAELVDMLGECGYPLERVPYPVWHRRLAEAVEQGADNALAKFLPLFGEDAPSADVGYAGSQPRFARDKLLAALSGSGIECRAVTAEFLSVYLDYFVSIGYLPPPAAR
jgi:thioester reductase-like protein